MGRELDVLPQDLETMIVDEAVARGVKDAEATFRRNKNQMRYKRKIKEKETLMNLVAKEEDPLDKQLATLAIVNEKVKKLKEGIPWNASKEDKKNFLYNVVIASA